MIGPVRQEILSGVRSEKQFKQLKNHLSYFPDLVLKTEAYERAAEICNITRRSEPGKIPESETAGIFKTASYASPTRILKISLWKAATWILRQEGYNSTV